MARVFLKLLIRPFSVCTCDTFPGFLDNGYGCVGASGCFVGKFIVCQCKTSSSANAFRFVSPPCANVEEKR